MATLAISMAETTKTKKTMQKQHKRQLHPLTDMMDANIGNSNGKFAGMSLPLAPTTKLRHVGVGLDATSDGFGATDSIGDDGGKISSMSTYTYTYSHAIDPSYVPTDRRQAMPTASAARAARTKQTTRAREGKKVFQANMSTPVTQVGRHNTNRVSKVFISKQQEQERYKSDDDNENENNNESASSPEQVKFPGFNDSSAPTFAAPVSAPQARQEGFHRCNVAESSAVAAPGDSHILQNHSVAASQSHQRAQTKPLSNACSAHFGNNRGHNPSCSPHSPNIGSVVADPKTSLIVEVPANYANDESFISSLGGLYDSECEDDYFSERHTYTNSGGRIRSPKKGTKVFNNKHEYDDGEAYDDEQDSPKEIPLVSLFFLACTKPRLNKPTRRKPTQRKHDKRTSTPNKENSGNINKPSRDEDGGFWEHKEEQPSFTYYDGSYADDETNQDDGTSRININLPTSVQFSEAITHCFDQAQSKMSELSVALQDSVQTIAGTTKRLNNTHPNRALESDAKVDEECKEPYKENDTNQSSSPTDIQFDKKRDGVIFYSNSLFEV